MKLLVFFALVVVAAARPDNHYDSKYDNFDMKTVGENQRLMRGYALCFIGTGRCTPEGSDFKGMISDGAQTQCAKCTNKQKVLVAQFIKALKKLCPEEYEILYNREDPEGKHLDALNEFIAKYGN